MNTNPVSRRTNNTKNTMNTNPLNCRKTLIHWLGAPLALLALLVASPKPAAAQTPPSLFTSAPTFASTNHILSTTVFHWFSSTGGQLSGPWIPMEGRANWTGTPEFWKGQVKQMMRANMDMLYVHQYADAANPNLATTNFPAGSMDPQQINLFTALSQLRAEGYDTPKVAPFLDTQITWNGTNIDLATTAGKNAFANQYIRFYNMYYSVNTDANADDYLAKQSNKPILDVYALVNVCQNITSLSRADVSNRLVAALGAAHPCFTNGFVMVGTATASPSLSFVDEKLYQFEDIGYHSAITFNGITSMKLNAGYWDQNIRTPGQFLARAGGVNFSNAWTYPDRATVKRANIESWNEYDEGSGVYAGTNAAPYKINGNPNNDTWSTTGDPLEYIKTTARGAALFCDVPAKSAKILWHNIPATLMPGESRPVTVIVRNAGSDLWTGATNYKLGQVDADPTTLVAGKRVLINDTQDEIPLYGGIFRGRAKAFTFTIQASGALGNYTNHFQMVQEGVAWFGDTLTNVITVKTKTAATVTLGNLSQMADGYNAKTVSATTTPAGLTVNLSYNGSVYPPTAAGSYTVVGVINNANYYGGSTNTLVLATNSIPNWSFEAQPTGTIINSPLGGGNVVDGSTITSWRFVNMNAANAGMTATIITNASAGNHAIRLDANYNGTGGTPYLDQWDVGMHTPVVYGKTYLVSVDAAWIAGTTVGNLSVFVQEFDNTGAYIGPQDVLGTVSVSSTGYRTYSFLWTPQNPSSTEIGFLFAPNPGVGSVSLSVDNVQIVDASNLPSPRNGSFEYSPLGATVNAPQGGGNVVDSSTLVGWRFVGMDSANASFSATIITNASAGKQALRFDKSANGPSYIDQWNPSMQTPVFYGNTYLVSMDAAWISGPTPNNLGIAAQEFTSGIYAGNTEGIGTATVSSTNYTKYAFLWTLQNPSANEISLSITPGAGAMSLDNVQIVDATTLPVPLNGSFEYSSMGATSSIGTNSVADGTTFVGWRLFSVGSPAIVGFTGTIVNAGSYAGGTPGSHAMRLDINNTGSPTNFDYGLDNNNNRIPVTPGNHYSLAFDLELDGITGGTELCNVGIAEFDVNGTFLTNAVNYTPTLPTDQTFHHYSVGYVPQNPNATQILIAFRPRNPGFISALVLDNVAFGPYIPVSNTVTVYRAAGSATQVKKARIMSYEALGLTFVANSGTTANGATLITDADTIYVPASGVDDSFTYTVTDGYGNNGTGTVVVKVGAPTGSPAVAFPNGDFTANPIGTAVGAGTGGIIDTTTFADWRFYSVGTPAADLFSATIIDASTTDAHIVQGGVPGTPAVRFDVNQRTNVGANHALDRDNARTAIKQGVTYTFSFDAALYGIIGGALSLNVVLPEFDGSGAFTGTQAGFTPTLDTAFRTYTYSWTPMNPAAVSAFPGFHPLVPGGVVSMGIGNVKLHAPVAVNLATNRASGSAMQVRIADLMAAVTDDQNHPLTFVGTSVTTTNGKALSNDGTYITVPANTVTDSFTYKITDGLGATNFATVWIAVTGGMSSTPTNIVCSVSGGNTLNLTWPGSYLGWIAQSNSVNVANPSYWFDIPGSQSVTNLNIPISPAMPKVFYRLRLP